MTVTLLGLLLLPIGILILLLKPETLLYWCVFFSGWIGASVINFQSSNFSIQPSYYFAFLWLLYRLTKIKKIKKDKSVSLLLLFDVYCWTSVLFPILENNSIEIVNVSVEFDNLKFTTTNITQNVYLAFCVIFYIAIVEYLKPQKGNKAFEKVINAYIIGVFAVCIVTLYQIVAIKVNLPFDELFRAGVHGNIQGTRIYGPSLEASTLSYYFLTALPLCIKKDANVKTKIVGILSVILGIYSYSSSYIVGLALFVIIELIIMLKEGKVSSRIITRILAVLAVVCVIIVSVASIRNYLGYALAKLSDSLHQSNVSGTQRALYAKTLLKAWTYYPITGVGFGSTRGTDLFTTWLCNVGLIGFIIFIAFFVHILLKRNTPIEFKVANIIVWIVMFISVPEPYSLFIWLFLAISYTYKKNKENVIYGDIT